VIGLDLGTGGARAVIVSAEGQVAAQHSVEFAPTAASRRGALVVEHEQDPSLWWKAARGALLGVVAEFEARGGATGGLQAIAIDGTSGTVVGVDRDGAACTSALMYNDGRAAQEALALSEWASEASADTPVRASWSLAKMLWLERHEPEGFARTHCFTHQADYVAAQLTGTIGCTDASNALKSGFDLRARTWPAWLDDRTGIPEKLPDVVEPGTLGGQVRDDVARELRLPPGLQVVAGATDGTAAFLASGAARVGDDNTTLGTTLVFKRLADHAPDDPTGLVYSHRLPDLVDSRGAHHERWLPGAASNVGGQWIRDEHPGADLARLDSDAEPLLPTESLAYPLMGKGERFPFLAPAALGFCDAPASQEALRFAARLQGVAFVERLAYEALDRVSGQAARGDVFATGGGSASEVWMQLRADVSGRTLHRPECHESAFGSAILAAANTIHDGLWDAMGRMLVIERSFHPDPLRGSTYDELFGAFRHRLKQQGYLEAHGE
jgi:sugar (pentulose or hexulose) kinase